MKRAWMVGLALAALVGCSAVPDGFTREGWERLRREDPNLAQAVDWVHGSQPRMAMYEIWMNRSGKRGDSFDAKWFYQFAEAEMLGGPQGGLKTTLLGKLWESRWNAVAYSEDAQHSKEERDAAKASIPFYDKAIAEATAIRY